MFTFSILAALGAAVVLFFWTYIADFFQKQVIPLFRKVLGDTVANILAAFVSFCDKIASWTRQQIKQAWKWFQQRILGMKTHYDKDLSQVKRNTITYSLNNEGKIIETVKTEILDWVEVPQKIRDKYIMENSVAFDVDDKSVIEGKFIDQVKKKENLTDTEVGELLEIQIA